MLDNCNLHGNFILYESVILSVKYYFLPATNSEGEKNKEIKYTVSLT